jgi:hypothetical protein
MRDLRGYSLGRHGPNTTQRFPNQGIRDRGCRSEPLSRGLRSSRKAALEAQRLAAGRHLHSLLSSCLSKPRTHLLARANAQVALQAGITVGVGGALPRWDEGQK